MYISMKFHELKHITKRPMPPFDNELNDHSKCFFFISFLSLYYYVMIIISIFGALRMQSPFIRM